MLYSKQNIYTIIENKELFKHPTNNPQHHTFIGCIDVFQIAYPKLHPSQQAFIDTWSQGYSTEELSYIYQTKINSIYKRKYRLVDKLYKILNGFNQQK